MSASRNSSTGRTSQFAVGMRPNIAGAASQLRSTWSRAICTSSSREKAVVVSARVRRDRRRGVLEPESGRDRRALLLELRQLGVPELVDLPRAAAAWSTRGSARRTCAPRRGARRGRWSPWPTAGAPGAPPGIARRPAPPRVTTSATFAPAASSAPTGASAGDSSVERSSSRSTWPMARSTTTPGDVRPAAAPSRATPVHASRNAGNARSRVSYRSRRSVVSTTCSDAISASAVTGPQKWAAGASMSVRRSMSESTRRALASRMSSYPAHRRVERSAVDRLQLLDRGPVQRLHRRAPGLARIRQAVVVAVITDERPDHRLETPSNPSQ